MEDKELQQLEARAEQLRRRIDHLGSMLDRLNVGQRAPYWAAKEELHAIYVKLLHPERLVLMQVDVEFFYLSKFTDVKRIMEELDARGLLYEVDLVQRRIHFWRRTPRGDFPPRILDVVEIYDRDGGVIAAPTELKKDTLIRDQVEGGFDKRKQRFRSSEVEAKYVDKYKGKKAIGGQLKVEEWVNKLAAETKVESIGLRGRNVVDHSVHRPRIKPGNLELSHLSPYESPGREMFARARTPSAPPVLAKTQPPGKPSGMPGEPATTSERHTAERPKTDHRSTGSSSSQRLNRPITHRGPASKPLEPAKHKGSPTAVTNPARGTEAVIRPETHAGQTRQAADAIRDTTITDARLTATADSAVASRMTQARGLGEVVEKRALKRTVYQFASKGARLLVKTGRFVLAVADFANPIFNILLGVDLVDALVSWLRREKVEEQREWVRIGEFLLGTPKSISSTYGIIYVTAVGPTINDILEKQLSNDSYPKNFLYWLEKWNSGRAWKGFVYPQIDIELERQEANSDAAFSVKYYDDRPITLSLVDTPLANVRHEDVRVSSAGPQDPRNRSTDGRMAPFADPKYNIVVKISQLKVRFTARRPILTPFDFMIVKARHLVAAIVTFISQYDDAIVDGMAVREEIMDGVNVNWLEGYNFPAPLDSSEIHLCLTSIFQALDLMKTHEGSVDDFKSKQRGDRFNLGYDRRLQILRKLGAAHAGGRLFYQVSLHLGHIVTASQRGSGIKEDLTYLRELALSIDADMVRAFNECRSSPVSLEYNYQG